LQDKITNSIKVESCRSFKEEMNAFACPMGCILEYVTTDREGCRQYKSNPEDCAVYPLHEVCFSKKQKQKVITYHIWKKYKDIARKNKLTATGKKLYKVHCSTIERSFADAKELHDYRYARFRGLKSVQMQAYLTAACQNMKKIALHLTKKGLVEGYFLKFYYLMLFSFTIIIHILDSMYCVHFNSKVFIRS